MAASYFNGDNMDEITKSRLIEYLGMNVEIDEHNKKAYVKGFNACSSIKYGKAYEKGVYDFLHHIESCTLLDNKSYNKLYKLAEDFLRYKK